MRLQARCRPGTPPLNARCGEFVIPSAVAEEMRDVVLLDVPTTALEVAVRHVSVYRKTPMHTTDYLIWVEPRTADKDHALGPHTTGNLSSGSISIVPGSYQ
ncbi:hypothetical protein Vretimale_12302, partial [Volvox reticuliferus]